MKNLRHKMGIVKTEKETGVSKERQSYTRSDAAKDVCWLKSAAVNKDNMSEIMEKIKSTSSYRREMLGDVSIDLLESFPYFFTNPKLVSTR